MTLLPAFPLFALHKLILNLTFTFPKLNTCRWAWFRVQKKGNFCWKKQISHWYNRSAQIKLTVNRLREGFCHAAKQDDEAALNMRSGCVWLSVWDRRMDRQAEERLQTLTHCVCSHSFVKFFTPCRVIRGSALFRGRKGGRNTRLRVILCCNYKRFKKSWTSFWFVASESVAFFLFNTERSCWRGMSNLCCSN